MRPTTVVSHSAPDKLPVDGNAVNTRSLSSMVVLVQSLFQNLFLLAREPHDARSDKWSRHVWAAREKQQQNERHDDREEAFDYFKSAISSLFPSS